MHLAATEGWRVTGVDIVQSAVEVCVGGGGAGAGWQTVRRGQVDSTVSIRGIGLWQSHAGACSATVR